MSKWKHSENTVHFFHHIIKCHVKFITKQDAKQGLKHTLQYLQPYQQLPRWKQGPESELGDVSCDVSCLTSCGVLSTTYTKIWNWQMHYGVYLDFIHETWILKRSGSTLVTLNWQYRRHWKMDDLEKCFDKICSPIKTS